MKSATPSKNTQSKAKPKAPERAVAPGQELSEDQLEHVAGGVVQPGPLEGATPIKTFKGGQPHM